MADKNVAFRMDAKEYEGVESLWKKAGFTSLQEAGLHAFRSAFEPGGPSADIPAKYRPYLKRLADVLASGNELVITAVTKNLDVFADYIRAGQVHPRKH